MANGVVHWELWSKDPAKVSDFYAKVFDWKIQNIPEMNYRMVEPGGQGSIGGGIFEPDKSGPWAGNISLYIDVPDLADFRKRVVAAGGRIVVEEQQVADMGWYSLFADPEGRVMGMWKTAKK